MRHHLVQRAIYSFLTAAVGLSTFYCFAAIAPNPSRWWYNATANGFLLFVTAIAAVIFGTPAWALVYLIFSLVGFPKAKPPEKPAEVFPID